MIIFTMVVFEMAVCMSAPITHRIYVEDAAVMCVVRTSRT